MSLSLPFSAVVVFLSLLGLAISSSAADIGYFVHISDVHIDTKYLPGSNPFCSLWTCCRNGTSSTTPAGLFGAPSSGQCGIPIETLDGVLEFVRDFPYANGVKPTAIFFTGDNTVNDCDKARGGCARSHITGTVDLINGHILNGLYDSGFCKPPNCVVLRAMGNHDGEPTENLELMPKGSWLVDHFAAFQSRYVDAELGAFYKAKGYFSITLGKMKVLAINTQWTSASNDYNKDYPKETHHPMTEWMMTEMQSAKENGENVIIIGHIPLSIESSRNYPIWVEEYTTLVRTYSDTLKLSFWGHTHRNNFYLTRDSTSKTPLATSIVTGSVTNQGHRNTVITVVQYDKLTNEILDIAEYYNDIEASNAAKTMSGNWHRLRSYRTDLGLSEISPAAFDDLIERMKTNDTLWTAYDFQRRSNYVWKEGPVCEGKCKKDLLCEMKFTSIEEHEECMKEDF